MEGKRYRWLWWILAAAVLAGIIWYAVVQNQAEDHMDGTLVWNPADTFFTSNRNYCHLTTITKPPFYSEGGLHSCQKPFI